MNTKEVITRRAKEKILEKFPYEIPNNHTLVGQGGIVDMPIAYYQPHNYRLYFDFFRENFNPRTSLEKARLRGYLNDHWTHEVKNVSESVFKFENCCTIKVKRRTIEIINNLEHKRWYPIELNDKIYDQVLAINEKKDKECLDILKEFIELFGGTSKFNIVNRYVQEHKVEGEVAVNKIPRPMKFYTPIVKKAYNEPNVEFKTAIQAATYLEDRAIERIAPEIQGMVRGILEINAASSRTLNQFITTFMPIEQKHSLNIERHTAVLENIDKSFKRFNRLLLERQKRLGEWI